MHNKEVDDGNCEVARLGGKEAYVKDMGLRIEMGYKADVAGKLAQHSEALSSAAEVNPEVACRNNVFLPGEISLTCDAGLDVPLKRRGWSSNGSIERREVSRDHSSRLKRAGSSCRPRPRPCRGPVPLSGISGWLTGDEGPNLESGNDRRWL